MGKIYSTDEKFLKDYRSLDEEGKYKAERYLKGLKRLQKWQLEQDNQMSGLGLADSDTRKDKQMTDSFYAALRDSQAEETKAKERSADYDYLRCSFCGKYAKHVKKMVQGPHGVRICNECIGLCSEIIAEDIQENDESPSEKASRQRAVAKEMLGFMERGHILGVEDFEREPLGEKPEHDRQCCIYANTGNFRQECLYTGYLSEKLIVKLLRDAKWKWTAVDNFVSEDGDPIPTLHSMRYYSVTDGCPAEPDWQSSSEDVPVNHEK